MRLALGLGLPAGAEVGFSPSSLAPIAWWRFEDGSGEVAVDSSGNGYDLTLVNTPTWIAGNIGGALNFNGSNETAQTTAAALLAALAGASEFSVTFWARAPAYGSNRGAFAIIDAVDAGNSFFIFTHDDDSGNGAKVRWAFENIINQNTGAVAVDEWHHYVFVSRSATDHEMYVDNASVGTSSTSKALAASVGSVQLANFVGAVFFDGDLDEVMIFDRALTADERAALFAWAG